MGAENGSFQGELTDGLGRGTQTNPAEALTPPISPTPATYP